MLSPSLQPGPTPRFAAKREAILDAAARLFNEKGLKGATLSDVAGRVGLITTSVTYYYRKKEDLAAACFLRTIAQIEGLIDASEGEPTPQARLRKFLNLWFRVLAEIETGERPELINFYDLRALTGPSVEPVFAAFEGLFRRVRQLFRSEGDAVFDRTEQSARAHLLLNQIVGARTWIGRFEADDYPRAAARMADVLIGGLAAEGQRWAPPALPPAAVEPCAADAAREAFLKAATELINSQGYHGASVDKISARLNVTKGSFYHHNETKDELVADCFERSFRAIRCALKGAAALEGSGWERLSAGTNALLRHQLSDRGPLLRYTALAALPEAMRQPLIRTMDRLADRIAGLIVDGMADGSIRPVDQTIAARMTGGMINAAANLRLWAPGATAETAAELFARPLLMGVFTPPRAD